MLFGITEPAISLIRKVEMYQWDEKSKSTKTDNVGGSQTTKTTYTYNQIWSEHPIKSANFRDQTPDKINPTDWKYTSQTMNAEDVQVGEYFILPEILSKLSNQNTVSLVGKTILGISANIPSTESDGVPKPRLVLE